MHWGLVVLLLLAGLAVRLYDLEDPPLDFHPTRQLHSLIMARGMYYQHATNVPEWQRERAVQQWRAEGVIEPPILERVVSLIYQLAGREIPYAARVVSSLFWLMGGVGLYALCRQFFSVPASLVGLGFFIVLPYAIFASRAFQPDPLMTALIVWSWWAFARWLSQPGWKQTWLAGLLGGGALLVKGTALFWVVPPLIGGVVARGGICRSLRDARFWVLGGLVLLPYGLYTLWGVWGNGFLQDQFSLRFFPQYWSDPAFYLRWFNLLDAAFGLPWLGLGLLGMLFLPGRLSRGLGWGAWLGYLLLGLALSHHIGTHDYYSLPLVPLLGWGLAALAEIIRSGLGEGRWKLYLAAGVLLGMAGMSLWQARTVLKRADYRNEPAFWAELADRMGRDAGVVGITQDYGARLVYWGWITPSNWLTAAEFDLRRSAGQTFDLQAWFTELTAGKQFFLVTMPEELDRQPELKELLQQHYPLFAQGPGYLIYDLRSPKSGGGK
ncbi:4-amino-4-deoxy-L-arabinose transferase [Anaerolinea thermolimosa]|nr:4-amino-4-deoxy-L-arabinose transferase [Anaerolinea thermolimosa]